jgi:Ion channel
VKRALLLLGIAGAWITCCGELFDITQHSGFVSGMYWAVTTASTVGYGDVTAKGTGGKLLAIGVMLTAIPLLAAVFALVTSAHIGARLAEHHRLIHERLDRLEEHQLSRTTPAPFRAGGQQRGIPVFATTSPQVIMADCSEFQPDINDATYLAWSKAIAIRALFGDAHDDAAWFGGARRADLHAGGAQFLGIYAFLVSGQSGAAQAQAFHVLVGGIQPGEVFIADLEEGDHALLTAWFNEMIALYGKSISPHLWTYTGLVFGEAAGILPVEWIADYASTEPSSKHKLWQFSDAYPVPGVGTADASLFHGDIDELAALAYQVPEKPPKDWTYAAPGALRVTPGHTNFSATWEVPAGAPETPAYYKVWAYKGSKCDASTLVASYPREETGTSTSPDPGSLEAATEYTVHVSAFGPDGTRAKDNVFAAARFTTGG